MLELDTESDYIVIFPSGPSAEFFAQTLVDVLAIEKINVVNYALVPNITEVTFIRIDDRGE